MCSPARLSALRAAPTRGTYAEAYPAYLNNSRSVSAYHRPKGTGSFRGQRSMKDTGLPQQDAQSDFARERRRRAYSKIASRLRFEPDDVSMMLPFEEVVAAL